MKPETYVIQLIIAFNAFVNAAQNALSNTWEGCTNECQMDIKMFCRQDIGVCMPCDAICGGGYSYNSQCEASCKGYMSMPVVKNIWEGCSYFCRYDLNYFCDVSTDTCIECKHICNVTAKYYNRQQCSSKCAGYLEVQKTTQIQTTTVTQAVSAPPSVSRRTRYTVPDNTNPDGQVVGLAVGLSIACFIFIMILIYCLKGKCKRNRKTGDQVRHIENGRPTEVRMNEGGVKVCLVNPEYVVEPAEVAVSSTLPYPHEETHDSSPECGITLNKESSELHEAGGAFRPL
ncbi:uncharacterized protein LOC117109774 isoform X2 [Anneissia japonica]|uniref:uncharacterized protein LOC117109774 isoform X2 n=1 Tax=Anneissia japonica TaxID=1529436 RepID=UPI001425720B|nr:uncharacterized protein LOC117109774 isoform X2 [Anneissia japonica]